VHVGQPLIAHFQPPVAIQPRQCPFGYPPVASQAFARLDATPRDPGLNCPFAKCLTATNEVVALVGMHPRGAFAWATRAATGTTDGRDSVEHRFEHARVVNVSRRVPNR
jgi:hypothetical protein